MHECHLKEAAGKEMAYSGVPNRRIKINIMYDFHLAFWTIFILSIFQ